MNAFRSLPLILVLAGVVIALAVLFNRDLLARVFGRIGRISGDERGPEPGDGAVIHHSSGEADFDGLSGDVPPPVKDAERDLPYPRKRSAD